MSEQVTVQYTYDEDLIKSFVTEPLLWKLTHGDEDSSVWEPAAGTEYLVGELDGEPFGIISFTQFNGPVCEAHIFLAREHWGTGLSDKFIERAMQLGLKTTDFTTAMVPVPRPQVAVTLFLKRNGFEPAGFIKDGSICNGAVTDLFLLTRKMEYNT